MSDLIWLIFFAVILGGLVYSYIFYLNQKGERLNYINKGICPKCKTKSIELLDQKGGGCSGTSFVEFKCTNCGYHDSFNISSGGCSGGSCKI